MIKMEIIFALLIAFFVGGAAGYLGTLMLVKRMSLAVDPLGHLALPGIALAMLLGFDISIGAFLAIIIGVFIIWLLQLRTKLPTEALTAIIFVFGVAMAFLFISEEDIIPVLLGDVSKINFFSAFTVVSLSSAIILVTKKIYPKMVLIGISEDIAKSEKIDVKLYELFYLVCVAIIVSLGVRVVGGLMAAALVAIPASASRNLARKLSHYSFFGFLIGALSFFLGVYFSFLLGIQPGIVIILINIIIFAFSVIFKR
mgnify:CR=1 FL=1